jgi:threonine/homoserine/homoserine lactone efflux protein
MPHPSSVVLFAVAALLLALTPGPAVLYIVARSVSLGRAAGVVSCLGIALGGIFHVLATALGLAALLATSALAFDLVRYAGAAYLVWLGSQKLRRAAGATAPETSQRRALGRVFRDGVMVNVLNPKTALFFLAFLPQFVAPSRGNPRLQLAFLGVLFVLIALGSDLGWALVASGAGEWLRQHPRFVSSERYVGGTVYIALGLAAAVSGRGRN